MKNVLFIGAVALGLVSALLHEILWDQAAFLYLGEQVLRGRLPYVDVIELNFPGLMYFHAVPALLHRLTGWSYEVSFGVFVWGFMAGCLGLLRSLLPRFTSVGLIFVLTTVLAVTTYHFGQREHVFTMSWLPYIVLRSLRSTNATVPTRVAILTGAMAGISLVLKPHFVLFWLGAEALALSRAKRLARLVTAETLAIIAVFGLYGAHFLLLGRSYVSAFLAHPVYEGLTTYSVFNYPLRAVFESLWPSAFICLALYGVLAFHAHCREGVRELSAQIFLMASLALLLYIVQLKVTSTYQLVPFWSSLSFGSLLIAIDLGSERLLLAGSASPVSGSLWSRRVAPGVAASITLATLIAVAITLPSVRQHVAEVANRLAQERPPDPMTEFLTHNSTAGDTVLILSTSIASPFPALLFAEREQGSRFIWLYMLPKAFLTKDNATIDTVVRGIVDDASRTRPRLILVSHVVAMIKPGGPFLLEKELLARPEFAQFVRARYQSDAAPLVGRWGMGWDTYTVYRRNG